MARPDEQPLPFPRGETRFATTHWSVVLAAGQRPSPDSHEALAALCETYWYPVYAYIRRKSRDAEEARDLTQAFFARLLEKRYLGVAERERGRFRSFLLACVNHFLANERDYARAKKRGGGKRIFSIDASKAEERYQYEPVDTLTADRIYDRRWALALLEGVLTRLRAEYLRSNRAELFESLKGFLTRPNEKAGFAEVANALGMTPGAIRVAVHRMRRRYRRLLEDEIAQTVDDPASVDEEIRDLFAALAP